MPQLTIDYLTKYSKKPFIKEVGFLFYLKIHKSKCNLYKLHFDLWIFK
jgi:hypothetical protein